MCVGVVVRGGGGVGSATKNRPSHQKYKSSEQIVNCIETSELKGSKRT